LILNSNLLTKFGKSPVDAGGQLAPDDALLTIPPLILPTVQLRFPHSHESLLGSGGGSYIFNNRTFQQAGVGNAQNIIADALPPGDYVLEGVIWMQDSTASDGFRNRLEIILPGMLGDATLISVYTSRIAVREFQPMQFSRHLTFATAWTIAFTYGRLLAGTTDVTLDLILTRLL